MDRTIVRPNTSQQKQAKDIQRLAQTYRSRLNPTATSDTLYDKASSYGHLDKHVGMTKVEVMDQLLSLTMHPKDPNNPKIIGCTNSFANEQTARADIIRGMYQSADNIAAWRYNRHKDAGANDTLVLYIPMVEEEDLMSDADPGVEPILSGNAFRQTKDDISTSYNTALVLVLNPLVGSRDDFRLTTSYPLTESEIAPKMEDDTLDIIKQTDAYKTASPFWKAVFEYKGMKKPAERPFAKVTERRNAFVISCGDPKESNSRNIEQNAVFLVYEDGNIKYRHERSQDQYKPPIPVTPANIAGYMMLYPQQTKLAYALSSRIQELKELEAGPKQRSKTNEKPKKKQKQDMPPRKKTKRPAAYPGKRQRGRESYIDYDYDTYDDYLP